jgi:hypothetical protein
MPNERDFEGRYAEHTCTANDCCSAKEKATRKAERDAFGRPIDYLLGTPIPDTGTRKLYHVTYTVHAYAYAENEREAIRLGRDAVDDFATDGAEAEEVQPGDALHDEDWEDDCLVYHKGKENISLDSVWPRPPVASSVPVEPGRPCVSCGDDLDADPSVTHCCGWGAVTSSPPSKNSGMSTSPNMEVCEHGYLGRCPKCDGHHP